VNRVIVVSPDDTGITSARAKTNRLDARTLASLLGKSNQQCVCVGGQAWRSARGVRYQVAEPYRRAPSQRIGNLGNRVGSFDKLARRGLWRVAGQLDVVSDLVGHSWIACEATPHRDADLLEMDSHSQCFSEEVV